MLVRLFCLSSLLVCIACLSSTGAQAQGRKAPPGMFKDLDDAIAGDALIIHGKQLFIDDYVIASLEGVKKVLNQPVKHPRNPFMRKDRKREFAITYGAVVRDEKDSLYKLWYQIFGDANDADSTAGYATSKDGIVWKRTLTDTKAGTNLALFDPKEA